MAINYPKFDQKINDQIALSKMQQAKPRIGTVVQYDKYTNKAVIVLQSQYAGTIGNIIKDVPCPMIYGIQIVSPEPGDECMVGFQDDNERMPYIITFINRFENGKITNNSRITTRNT